MPSLGADMESGTLLEWYVKPGDAVKRGDIIAVVDTSKAEIEVEIFEDGVIEELLVPEGTRVPVGTVLATVRPAGSRDAAAAPVRSSAKRPQHRATPEPRRRCAEPQRPCQPPPRVRRRRRSARSTACASPRSRAATAERLGVDLSTRLAAADRTARSRGPTSKRAVAGSRRTRRATASARGAGPPGRRGRTHRSPGRDARGDRRADGALEARDSPLLPGDRRST